MKLTAVLDKYLTVLLVILVLGALSILAYIVTVPKASEKYTDFYILGQDGKAGHYPEDIVQGEKCNVFLHVENYEYKKQNYIVEVWIGEEKVGIWFEEAEMEELPLSLANKEVWENEIGFILDNNGNNQMVKFQLFKEGDSEVYRTLHLYVDVKPF